MRTIFRPRSFVATAYKSAPKMRTLKAVGIAMCAIQPLPFAEDSALQIITGVGAVYSQNALQGFDLVTGQS